MMKLLVVLATCFSSLLLCPDQGLAESNRPTAQVVAQTPHSNIVRSIAVATDNTWFATGGDDGIIKVWDFATLRLLRSIKAHPRHVNSLSISKDGTTIVSAGHEDTICAWSPATGTRLWCMKERQVADLGPSISALFTRDERLVIGVFSDSINSQPRIFRVSPEGNLVGSTTIGSGGFLVGGKIAVSADGKRLALGQFMRDESREIILADLETGSIVARKRKAHKDDAEYLALSPDGDKIYSADKKSIKIWDTRSDRALQEIVLPQYIFSMVLSPDGKTLVAACGGTIYAWEADSGKKLAQLPKPDVSFAYGLAFSTDGQYLISGQSSGTIRKWRTSDWTLQEVASERVNSPATIVVLDEKVHQLNYDSASVWDLQSGDRLSAVDRPLISMKSKAVVNFSIGVPPSGRPVMATATENSLLIWDLEKLEAVRTLPWKPLAKDEAPYRFALSPDASLIVAGSASEGAPSRVYDVATGAVKRQTPAHSKSYFLQGLSFSPDAKLLITTSGENYGIGAKGPTSTMKLWELQSGRLRYTIEQPNNPSNIIKFAPDGRTFVAEEYGAKGGYWVRQFDTATGKPLRALLENSPIPVFDMAYSPDGKSLLVAQYPAIEMREIVVAEGGASRNLRELPGAPTSVAYNKDATRIVAGTATSSIVVWGRKSARPLAIMSSLGAKNWLTYTSDGFFSGTAAYAEHGLHIVRGFETFSLGQVFQALYAPDLIRAALADDTEGEVASAASVLDLDKVLDSGPAPEVAVRVAGNGELADVEAEITDRGEGIGRIEWRVNGVTAAVQSGPNIASDGKLKVIRKLGLDPGPNAIEVVAYNAGDLLASVPARASITFSAAADAKKPNLFVLSIGINAYLDKGWKPPGRPETQLFPPLSLAVTDAKAIAENLQRSATGFYSNVRITTLLDGEATRSGIEATVNKLAAEIRPQDTFILFVAAHGKSEAGHFYLIPQDHQGGPDPAAMARHAIDQGTLQDWLANRIKAKKAVLLLDTCESGALVGGYSRSRIGQPAADAAMGRLHEATGRPVLAAAAEGKPAFEGYEGHGVFTWALIDALRNGDRNGNGTIELSELVARVQDQVPRIAASLSGSGRAAIAARGLSGDEQTARFGSRGEDFSLANRLR